MAATRPGAGAGFGSGAGGAGKRRRRLSAANLRLKSVGLAPAWRAAVKAQALAGQVAEPAQGWTLARRRRRHRTFIEALSGGRGRPTGTCAPVAERGGGGAIWRQRAAAAVDFWPMG